MGHRDTTVQDKHVRLAKKSEVGLIWKINPGDLVLQYTHVQTAAVVRHVDRVSAREIILRGGGRYSRKTGQSVGAGGGCRTSWIRPYRRRSENTPTPLAR